MLNGLIPHFFEGELKGLVRVFGTDTRKMSLAQLFPCVGMVLQNADAQLFNSSVEDELAFGLESLGLSENQINKRIIETSRLLHISHLLPRPPDQLSGGEKRMVGIAAILCLKPAVLILDEPYANLDQEGISKVRAVLKKIHASGLTVVIIEHRAENFINDATRCLVIDEGSIIFDGKPEHCRTILFSRGLIPQYPERGKSRGSTTAAGEKHQSFLSVHNLCYQIKGRTILDGVSFEIFKGQAVALLGKNGAGKTTLIKHIIGLYRPDYGSVKLNNRILTGKDPRKIAEQIGLSFQNPNDQFFKTRVKDELYTGPRMIRKIDPHWINQICRLFRLNELLHRSAFHLSEGEKKRVAIASILAMKPQLLILDEPTAGQDGLSKKLLAVILEKLICEGLTIIVATHDLEFADAVANRRIVLDKGKIIKDSVSGL